jgi:surface protein
MSSQLELTYNFPDAFTLTLPIFNGIATLIEWGDEETSTDNTRTHKYLSAGIYTVKVTGKNITKMSYFIANDSVTGNEYLIACTSFGEIGLTDISFAFFNTPLLITIPSSLPTLSRITNMENLFRCAGVNTDYSSITGWDVSTVTNMSNTFSCSNMNVDISGWDVSSVTTMSYMFAHNSVFNQPLNGWGSKTGNVTDMRDMFNFTTSFNQPIGNWDVSKVNYMLNMFSVASSFNQDISSWDVSNANYTMCMFASADSFNYGLDPGVDPATSINPLSWAHLKKCFYGNLLVQFESMMDKSTADTSTI